MSASRRYEVEEAAENDAGRVRRPLMSLSLSMWFSGCMRRSEKVFLSKGLVKAGGGGDMADVVVVVVVAEVVLWW